MSRLLVINRKHNRINISRTVLEYVRHYLKRIGHVNCFDLADMINRENGRQVVTPNTVSIRLYAICRDKKVLMVPSGSGMFIRANEQQYRDWSNHKGQGV